jgi:hypothetical protein
MTAPPRHPTPQLFDPLAQPNATALLHLCCDLNALLNCWFPLGASRIAAINQEFTDNAARLAANYGKCGNSICLIPSFVDHEIATGIALAGFERGVYAGLDAAGQKAA